LAAEVAALEADEDDRREMTELAAFMESMACSGVTFTSSGPHAELVTSNKGVDTA
jgi:hypothetical protein